MGTQESAVQLSMIDDVNEAFRALNDRARRRTGDIPPEALVELVMEAVPAEEWSVRVDAIDAVIRRLEAARRDGLEFASRPEDNRVLGQYATARAGGKTRPYRSVLRSVEPIRGSCDCPDFLKNSLGVCKHLLTVLDRVYARPRLVAQALREQEVAAAAPITGLRWDPYRPLTGAGDWLERVTWVAKPGGAWPGADAAATIGRWFRAATNGVRPLKQAFADKPEKRLELVTELAALHTTEEEDPLAGDPALAKLLADEQVRLKQVVEGTLSIADRRAAWKGLKRSLYPYQQEGVLAFLATGRLLLADDMGLGKTAQAISAVDILWRQQRVKRGLIIAPASLKPQWAREWALFSETPIHVLEGSPTERQRTFEEAEQGLFIISYEQMLRDLDAIRAWNPDLVVLDEAQRIKNWATKTALSVKGLTPRYRLILTGTPMENRIEELASIVEWVDGWALEPKWRLGSLHSMRADGTNEVTGMRHLETLRERLRPSMVRRVRQEVLDQLPPRTDVRVPIAMTPAQKEEHDALTSPIVQLIQRSKRRPLAQAEFLRLMSLLTTQRIISNGLAQLQYDEIWPAIRHCQPEDSLLQSISSPKLIDLRQLIDQLVNGQKRKVVIFSQWRRMLALAHWAIGDILAANHLRAGFFTGAEGQRRRTQNIVEFHDDPNFRVLFATDAGGVGLNLQHASNCVINLELPWNPAVLEQRIGRVYRLGQSHPIDVFNIVSEEGIESRIASIVDSKQAFFKGLFDGASDVVEFEQAGSFLDRVEKLIDPGAASGSGHDLDTHEYVDIDLADHTDGLDELLDAADESVTPPAEPTAPHPASSAASEPVTVSATSPTTTLGAGIATLFGNVHVRRESGGKLIIEADEQTADALTALFQGMAGLLQSATAPTRDIR